MVHLAFVLTGGITSDDTTTRADLFDDVNGAEVIENLSASQPAPKDNTIVDLKVIASGYVRTGAWVWVNDSVNSAYDNGIWAAICRPWDEE